MNEKKREANSRPVVRIKEMELRISGSISVLTVCFFSPSFFCFWVISKSVQDSLLPLHLGISSGGEKDPLWCQGSNTVRLVSNSWIRRKVFSGDTLIGFFLASKTPS